MTQLLVHKQVADAQIVRSRLLGSRAIKQDEIDAADQTLSYMCKDKRVEHWVRSSISRNKFLRDSLTLSLGWYSGEFLEKASDISREANIDMAQLSLMRCDSARVVLFREAFIRFSKEEDIWSLLNDICDIKPLEEYAKNCCCGLDLAYRHYFYHDSWSKIWKPNASPEEKFRHARVLYPMYESVIIAFLLSLFLVVFGVEYQKWRNRRRERREIAELNARVEDLERILTVMLFESVIRQTLLMDKFPNGALHVDYDTLAKIYIEDYLPVVRMLRISRGADCPIGILGEKDRCQAEAKEILEVLFRGIEKLGRIGGSPTKRKQESAKDGGKGD